MTGVLLDPVTGQPESRTLLGPSGVPAALEENERRGWRHGAPARKYVQDNAPESVKRMLERGRIAEEERDLARRNGRMAFEPRASMQSWNEIVYATIADGTQVIASTTETIMVPDYSIPAGWMIPGRALRYTVLGNVSTVITTPGTITARLRWGGVAGTSLAASGAFAPDPTAASTTVSVMFQWTLICRTAGSSGTILCMGWAEWNDYDDASAATIVGNLNMKMMPVSAPAVATVNTQTANALSPTIQFSVTTATTQFTANLAVLEALN